MNYLFGDSTESNLDFNYLAFLREVIDCAVVMAESEGGLTAAVDKRRTRDREVAAALASVEDLGKRAAEVVAPLVKDGTPTGRCAASIATAIKEAVDREATHIKHALAVEREEMDRGDQKLRLRAKDVLEKLLRTHDLPNADKELEITWTHGAVKATMRQHTSFGVEAVIQLELPPSSVFGLDLKVDRIAEGVEVHAVEAGGWLKKSDKIVPHKLGRYQIVRVVVGGDGVSIRLRSGPDANATGFEINVHRKGEITIEATGSSARELTIDDQDRPGLRTLAERLEAAVKLLETRAGVASIEIDGKPFADHPHPRVLAERLIVAIAPTVQNIAKHSRSPGELVLRRLISENRREELFVSTAELVQKLAPLPASERELFAPLQLSGEPVPESVPQLNQPNRVVAAVPMPERSAPSRTAPPPMPEPRRASKTAPPPISTPPIAASGPIALDKPKAVTVPTQVPAITKPEPTPESLQVTRASAAIVDDAKDEVAPSAK